MSALSVLVFGGPRSLRELAEAEHVTAPTMSAIVSGLEQDGLVRRRGHPSDRRAIWIEPTAKGRRLMQTARGRRIATLVERFSQLDAGEVETLRRAAEIVEEAISR
jgi:DNA-binding MarR family transcriptional regulator